MGVGSLTYQWQRSAADSDADYSDIPGATTASYDDTGAPEDGGGRYYRCRLNAAGAAQQYSTSDRGYRGAAPNPPTNLLTEGQTNPTNITDFYPEFSAIFTDNTVGDNAENAWIQVSTDSTFATATHWDSGWIDIATTENNARCPDITYGGSEVVEAVTYYWRIRFM
ncbi:unnamed protein product, partial [marine sediment metagenome]